jgi:hypothetical protein
MLRVEVSSEFYSLIFGAFLHQCLPYSIEASGLLGVVFVSAALLGCSLGAPVTSFFICFPVYAAFLKRVVLFIHYGLLSFKCLQSQLY